jgi:hypothetical protein
LYWITRTKVNLPARHIDIFRDDQPFWGSHPQQGLYHPRTNVAFGKAMETYTMMLSN